VACISSVENKEGVVAGSSSSVGRILDSGSRFVGFSLVDLHTDKQALKYLRSHFLGRSTKEVEVTCMPIFGKDQV